MAKCNYCDNDPCTCSAADIIFDTAAELLDDDDDSFTDIFD